MERLGPYRIEKRLGSGGMGAVYQAHDERLDRLVAIKYIRDQDYDSEDLRHRFQREARAAAQLNHPAIVQIFDFVQEEDCDWIVMEHAGGRTLKSLLQEKGSVDLARALPVLREIAHGLAEAHRHGVVHRDVKTDNVMITEQGRVKILDFGVARRILADHPQDRTLTLDGMIIGTPHAMSPEQANGRAVDHRTDLFSFGTLCYETLTGECPFKATNSIKTLYKICTFHPPPVWELVPTVPEELSDLIEALLAKDPADRPADAGEVARRLDRMVGLEISGYFSLHLEARQAEPAEDGTETVTETGLRVLLAAVPHRREVTLLAGEHAGETAGDPEALFELRPALRKLVAGVLRRFGGALAERSDGGFLAIFGHPRASGDDARRTVAAGREILRRAAEAGGGLELGLGVHTGPAVARAEGEELALAATGRRAAGLARAADPGTLLLSAEIHALIRPLFFSCESVDEGTYRCLEARPPQEEADDGPFLGRRREMEILRMGWRWVGLGRGQVVLLGGAAGIGKSRLVRAFREDAAREALWARALPENEGVLLAPFAEMLERRLGSGADVARLEGFFAELGMLPRRAVPVLARLLGIPLAAPYAPLDSSAERRELVETIVQILVELARQEPLFLVVEDLHRADSATREVLDLLAERAARTRILVILTFRPEFEPPWSGAHVTSLVLSPLGREEAEELVDTIAGDRPVAPALRERILERGAGGPQALAELTRALAGREAEGFEAWRPIPVPPALAGGLRAELDRLEPSLAELAGLGAVLGPLFSYELLAAVADLAQEDLRARLDALVEAEVLERHGAGTRLRFTFRRALVRDAAYAALWHSRRREVHSRVAEELAGRFAGLVEERPELLAYHREAGG